MYIFSKTYNFIFLTFVIKVSRFLKFAMYTASNLLFFGEIGFGSLFCLDECSHSLHLAKPTQTLCLTHEPPGQYKTHHLMSLQLRQHLVLSIIVINAPCMESFI